MMTDDLTDSVQPTLDSGIHGEGVSDAEITYNNPSLSKTVNTSQPIVVGSGYTPGSPLAMAYGGNDASATAGSMVQNGSMFRMERGWPYYRGGSPVKIQPQFKALNVYCQNIQSRLSPTFYADAQNGILTWPKTTK